MTKAKKAAGSAPGLDVTLIDQWLAEHYEQPSDILGKEGLLAQLTKAVVKRALSAELTHHLGYYRQTGEPPVLLLIDRHLACQPFESTGETPVLLPERKQCNVGKFLYFPTIAAGMPSWAGMVNSTVPAASARTATSADWPSTV